MKLRTPAWKTAWYEEGLSERFAQEMSRIERTVIKDIETSAQWVEQLVIELGMLAQNMIHLEGESRRDSQIRLAFEKALKISALAAHLMGALDQAVDHGPSLLRYSGDDMMDRTGSFTPPPENEMKPMAVPPPPAAPIPPMPAAPAAPQVVTASAHANNGNNGQHAAMRTNPSAQLGIKRQAAQQAPVAAPTKSIGGADPIISTMMDMSQSMVSPNGNPMREMILSLSRRGLSRSEIEVLTEQPRHVIEAVLAAG